MEFESKLALLNDRIARLESKNFSLKNEKSRIFERIVEIPPTDYESIKDKLFISSQQIGVLQNRCKALEHLLLFNDGSPSAHIIHNFKAITPLYLIQLAKEIEDMVYIER